MSDPTELFDEIARLETSLIRNESQPGHTARTIGLLAALHTLHGMVAETVDTPMLKKDHAQKAYTYAERMENLKTTHIATLRQQ